MKKLFCNIITSDAIFEPTISFDANGIAIKYEPTSGLPGYYLDIITTDGVLKSTTKKYKPGIKA